MLNEELLDKELEKLSQYLGSSAENAQNSKNIKPAKDTVGEEMLNSINLTKRVIIDLRNSIRNLRETKSDFRSFVRGIGNSINGLNKYLKERPSKKKFVKSLLSNNTYENLVRLPILIKSLKVLNQRRMASSYKSMYKDFSKEINELELLYNNFLTERLASITTEEVDYFPY